MYPFIRNGFARLAVHAALCLGEARPGKPRVDKTEEVSRPRLSVVARSYEQMPDLYLGCDCTRYDTDTDDWTRLVRKYSAWTPRHRHPSQVCPPGRGRPGPRPLHR